VFFAKIGKSRYLFFFIYFFKIIFHFQKLRNSNLQKKNFRFWKIIFYFQKTIEKNPICKKKTHLVARYARAACAGNVLKNKKKNVDKNMQKLPNRKETLNNWLKWPVSRSRNVPGQKKGILIWVQKTQKNYKLY
jgi:hypothetical protein